MPLPLIALLAPAIAAVGASIRNAVEQRRANKEANRTNLALADKEFAHNKEMWELQNQYNDPRNQMARLGGAGLNPNMIYGSGAAGASGNSSGASPRYNAPTVIPEFGHLSGDIPNMLGMYQDFQMKQAQIDNVKAQTANVVERTTSEPVARLLKDIQGKAQDFNLQRSRIFLFP